MGTRYLKYLVPAVVFAALPILAGCSKKEVQMPAVSNMPAEMPELEQNKIFQKTQRASPPPDYSFRESPNDGLENTSEEDKKTLIPNVD